MNTEELWSAAIGQVQSGYLSLPDTVKSELAEILDSVAELKSSIASLASADAECEKCGGVCCRFGKHHFTVVDLLGYLNADAELFSPDFANPVCPYHSGYGCKMTAAFRPYNCVIFICEEVECRLDPEALSRLRSLEQALKGLYCRIEALLGNRFENGLFITYERSLVSGEKLFRY